MPKQPSKPSRGQVTTRSGRTLKVNRSLGERWAAMRDAKTLRKVNRLRGLPKSRLKRLMWHLQPKHVREYWFSRDGAIMALKITGIGIVIIFLLTLSVFAYFRKDLSDVTDISGSNLGGSISYYDRSGQTLLWQDYNAVKRVPIQSKDINPYIKQATVAIEDKDFYSHRGFDVRGIARAAYVDAFSHSGTQGGSTITQQLVKLTEDFNQDRNLTLKVKELILAVELERTYTKDEILTGYLNAAPYGGVDYGVQAASADYFHKDPKDLTLAEAAFLASIPKSPAYYSPYSSLFNKPAFVSREHYVLDQMAQQGKITKAQADAAKKVDVLAEVKPIENQYAGIKAPYFVLAARDELYSRFASKGPGSKKIGGWKVITTVDMNLQSKAEQTVQNNRANVQRYGGDEEALVVEDVKTGQMLASVGGVDFNDANHGELNYAHDVNISPGSSFKPYDYTTLIDNNANVGAGSVLYDSQGPIPGYSCTDKTLPPPRGHGNCLEDYDFNYPGPETLRYALGGSRNVPAVKAMLQSVPNDTSDQRVNSVNKTISTANALMAAPDAYRCFRPGIDVSQAKATDEAQCYGASAIGDGAYLHLDQHINGVASLARLGYAFSNTYIMGIHDSAGKEIYQYKQPKGTQVVRQESAYIVDNMASDPNASYLTGSYKWHRYKGWTTAVKTGTTNDSFDGLMMGWNTQYAVGSWVGYHTRNKALTTFMENLTVPLTRTMMEYAIDNSHLPAQSWTEPSGIQHLPAYVVSHKLSKNGEIVPSPNTDIFPSWYKQKAVSSANVTIDKVSGKLATSCTPEAAKQTTGGAAAPNAFSIDQFYPPGQTASSSASANTAASDDVHSCSDSPPSITLTVNGGSNTCDTSCTISAAISQGTHAFDDPQYAQFPGTVTFSVDGQVVKTIYTSSGGPYSFTYTPNSTEASGKVSATVTDSVLYSATDSATVNFTVAAAPPSTTITLTNTSYALSWNTISGASYYIVNWTKSGHHTSGHLSTNTYALTPTGSYTSVYVEAYDTSNSKISTSNSINAP